MKKLIAGLLVVFFVNATHAQTTELQKIAAILEKNLTGKQFLGGMYDPPCFGVDKLSIGETGIITITGEGKGCNITLFIKDASVKSDGPKISIYQASPRINTTFYVENNAVVYQAFQDLKKLLNK